MKIPGPPAGVKSTALPTPYSNVNTRGAFGEAYEGAFDKAIGATGKVADAADREIAAEKRAVEEAKRQAEGISKANADAAYQRGVTSDLVGSSNRRSLIDQAFDGPEDAEDPTAADVKHQPGFLSSRGKEAYAKSPEVLDRDEKRRQQIAKEHFADPEARERWLAHNLNARLGTERRVEEHAANQFEVARKDALQGAQDSALQAILNEPNDAEASVIAKEHETRIRELQVSKEGGDADIQDFRRQVLGTRIAGLITDDQVDRAEGQYEAAKQHLGKDAPRVKAMIDAAKKAQAVRTNDVEAQKSIDAILNIGTSVEGKPDLEHIDELVRGIPAGPLRDEMEQRAGPAKEKALRRWKEKVDGYADAAGTTFEKTLSLGAIDAKVKSWLQDNAPEEWKKLRHDANAELARQRARRTGNAEDRRAQSEIDRLAMLEFRELPIAERATTDVNAFLRGRGTSSLGASAVKGEQTRTREVVKSGDAEGEAEFVRQVEAETRGIAGSNKNKAKDLKAQAVQAYGELRTAAKGKPSSADVRKKLDELTTKAASRPRLGDSIWGKGVETDIERRAREQKANLGNGEISKELHRPGDNQISKELHQPGDDKIELLGGSAKPTYYKNAAGKWMVRGN